MFIILAAIQIAVKLNIIAVLKNIILMIQAYLSQVNFIHMIQANTILMIQVTQANTILVIQANTLHMIAIQVNTIPVLAHPIPIEKAV